MSTTHWELWKIPYSEIEAKRSSVNFPAIGIPAFWALHPSSGDMVVWPDPSGGVRVEREDNGRVVAISG